MKKGKRWLLVSAAFLLMLVSHSDAVAPFKKVSIATTTASTAGSSTTTTASSSTEAPPAEADEAKSHNSTESSGPTKNPKLTGIPQIDWIWDPNLPRELRGYNLSNYPFFSTTPPEEDIHFKCDGLHDGFYASIEFKCQVYHHCVYGIRHDFLCANFTAFDQRTFICHFVSDVDCENSQKFWSRNDNLYMATTTSTTSTTTTEPPPTQHRRRPIARPLRPLRRPMNRRPADDYYYDDEEYDDDYYEERLNRRRKQRPRHRKPLMDYEEEYEEKRTFSDDEKPRRTSSRDRVQAEDELEEDYDADRRKYDRPKSRTKAPAHADRRKPNGGRKPGTIGGRPANPDERRSFSDDRPINGRKDKLQPVEDEIAETDDLPPPRRSAGRRRVTDKIPSTASGADIETPISASDQQEAADEEAPPKVKTTPKPLEEFVTPKAAPASVFARPRAPPRIPRPVPVNEKKKFQYAVQKTATTIAPAAAVAEEDDLYEDELYEDVRPQHGHPRRRITDDAAIPNRHDGEEELPQAPARRRGGHNDAPIAGRKPTRTTLRKPVTEKKPLEVDDEEYDNAGSASNERSDSRSNARKRLYSSRNRSPFNTPSARGSEDVDFVDDEYEEHPISRPAHRLRPNARKHLKKSRPPPTPPTPEEEEDLYEPEPEPERPLRNRAGNGIAGRRKNLVSVTRQRLHPSEEPSVEEVKDEAIEEEEAEPPKTAPSKASSAATGGRPTSVRVVKRPFLPSRGGSPYLPRGLQPVGAALKSFSSHTTDSTPIDMGSTISGVRLLEHGAPLLRDSGTPSIQEVQGPRTTLPPRSPLPIVPVLREEAPSPPPQPQPQPPKVSLDELYENDYDVTLNDALNPTLKPLPSHQSSHHLRNYQSAFAPSANAYNINNNQSPAIHHNNYQHSNAYQVVPQQSQQTQTLAAQPHQSHQHQLHQQPQQQQQSSNYNSDSYFSSTDIRRRAIIPAAPARSSRTDYRDVGTRIAQHFYDDIEYN